MPDNAILPEFSRIEKTLNPLDPCETHGILCGMLCADEALPSDLWIRQILSETAMVNLAAEDTLHTLFDATVDQFNNADLSFYLLLPDDDAPLSHRAESLGRWCQGYLTGLGLGGMQADPGLPGEVNEFLGDLMKIARVGFFDTDNADEEDEAAYTEIVEYVRVGVLLVSHSLRATTSVARTLH